MKRIIAFFLLIALVASAGACSKPSKGGSSSSDSPVSSPTDDASMTAVKKIEAFCDTLNDRFNDSSIVLPEVELARTPKCTSNGLIITIYYELVSPNEAFDSDQLILADHENIPSHYSIYEEMKQIAESDEVRLSIKYMLDGSPVLSYIIDRTFDPAATMIPVPSFPDD